MRSKIAFSILLGGALCAQIAGAGQISVVSPNVFPVTPAIVPTAPVIVTPAPIVPAAPAPASAGGTTGGDGGTGGGGAPAPAALASFNVGTMSIPQMQVAVQAIQVLLASPPPSLNASQIATLQTQMAQMQQLIGQ